jgi:hypothetical protein
MSKYDILIIVVALLLVIWVMGVYFNSHIKKIYEEINKLDELDKIHIDTFSLLFKKTTRMDKEIYINSFNKLVKDDFTKVTKVSNDGFEAVLAYTKTDHGEKIVYGEYLLKRIKFDNETYQYVGEKYDKQKV